MCTTPKRLGASEVKSGLDDKFYADQHYRSLLKSNVSYWLPLTFEFTAERGMTLRVQKRTSELHLYIYFMQMATTETRE